MTDIQHLALQFWEQGYLVLEDFYDAELMDRYLARIMKHYGMHPDWEHDDDFIAKAATEVVPWFPQREGDNTFDPVDQDPKLRGLTEAILGEGWEALYCMAMFSRGGTVGQAWHQDCPPEESKHFNLNRLLYTHDITEELGGETVVVPGSHRRGVLPSGNPHESIDGEVVLRPKKGTVVILHGHAWHRVLPIKGDYRVSVNFRAVNAQTPEDITDIAVYRNMRYRFSTAEVVEER